MALDLPDYLMKGKGTLLSKLQNKNARTIFYQGRFSVSDLIGDS